MRIIYFLLRLMISGKVVFLETLKTYQFICLMITEDKF
ncbi:hypothetical protein M33023_02080 [Candidatus Phytoplasma asteris]|uniref:Uncharacterized protein n=1 Tax=Candidatus Phytoplasma asteris TaxID=85620 RepID=A0ABZ2YHT1_9MOLU